MRKKYNNIVQIINEVIEEINFILSNQNKKDILKG